MIDFYAIRAQQYSWFCEFVQFWDPSKNLTMLPNMAFSLALAHFYSGKNPDQISKEADARIQKALIDFPGVLLPLLDKISVEVDQRVMLSPYFLDAQSK